MLDSIKQFFIGFFSFDKDKYWNETDGWHTCPSCEGPIKEEPRDKCESGAHSKHYVQLLKTELKKLKERVN
jgi:hypothetical protein